MKILYKYKNAKYPVNDETIELLSQKIFKLENILLELDLGKINISDYNKRYFGDKIKNLTTLRFELTKYLYLICWSIHEIKKNISQITFVDYGGGHGLYSLVAKICGFKKVIYNDIYEQSCLDAKKIASYLNLTCDHYIPGDITSLNNFFTIENIEPDIISSYDVLEHIYDLKFFFGELNKIKSSCVIYFASAANDKNPLINFKLKKLHNYFENSQRDFKFGRKPTDTIKSLRKLREEIINTTGLNFNKKDLNYVIKNTRGLLYKKIIEQAKYYYKNKSLIYILPYKSNTCDPLTGNWFENLINHDYLKKILSKPLFKSSSLL